MSKKPNIRRKKKKNVITEALLKSCCQKEPVFSLNYPIMAGYLLARCIIQKILSFSVQPKATSRSIWNIKCNSACWIFPVLFLLTWHCIQQLKFFKNTFLWFSEYLMLQEARLVVIIAVYWFHLLWSLEALIKLRTPLCYVLLRFYLAFPQSLD